MELAPDAGHVVLHGLGRDEELGADLLVGPAGHDQARHVDLAVDRRVLIPRPETELVAGAAIELAQDAGPIRTVADLGTGSGAIGLALADELPLLGTTVWMTDSMSIPSISDSARRIKRCRSTGSAVALRSSGIM